MLAHSLGLATTSCLWANLSRLQVPPTRRNKKCLLNRAMEKLNLNEGLYIKFIVQVVCPLSDMVEMKSISDFFFLETCIHIIRYPWDKAQV